MNFQQAGIQWENNKRQYIKDNFKSEPIRQLNMIVPDSVRLEVIEFIEDKRKSAVDSYYQSERSRLSREFESTNPSPQSKDYQ